MYKPKEGLDDFIVKAAPESSGPPRPVWLHKTGEVEVVRPLVTWQPPSRGGARWSWFQSLLIVGGSFAMMALVLLSAVAIEFYDTTVYRADGSNIADYPSDLPIDQRLYDELLPTEEPFSSDVSTDSSLADDQPTAIRSRWRARRSKPRVRLIAAYRPRREPSRPLLIETGFMPTTLVIYAENGEIKTRIEPQLRRPLS